MVVENALSKRVGLRMDQYGGPLCIPICMFASWLLVPKALSMLGIRVRGRFVERFRAADRDEIDGAAVELPIRIRQGPWFIWIGSAVVCLLGLDLLRLAWFPPPGRHHPVPTLAGLGFIIFGLLITRLQPPRICEISDEGIRAPEGFWGRQTFVLWEELTRCEIVHDDEKGGDYFDLWDRAGRRRFKAGSWIGTVKAVDRATIYRALRLRFPQKEKTGQPPEPETAHQASSAMWDRELDG
jgi:hypothetical protein